MTKLVDFLKSQHALEAFQNNIHPERDQQAFFKQFGNKPTAIMRAFDWDSTFEGHVYWAQSERDFHRFLVPDRPSFQSWLIDNTMWQNFTHEFQKSGQSIADYLDIYMFDPDAIHKAFAFDETLFGVKYWTEHSMNWGLACTNG